MNLLLKVSFHLPPDLPAGKEQSRQDQQYGQHRPDEGCADRAEPGQISSAQESIDLDAIDNLWQLFAKVLSWLPPERIDARVVHSISQILPGAILDRHKCFFLGNADVAGNHAQDFNVSQLFHPARIEDRV